VARQDLDQAAEIAGFHKTAIEAIEHRICRPVRQMQRHGCRSAARLWRVLANRDDITRRTYPLPE
jgi:hypothetical protein